MGAKKYAYVNYKMLVWARSETPFGTTSDVANHISGFRSEVIDKWERGEELPSITEAKKLANLYKVPFATFYLSNPPEKKQKLIPIVGHTMILFIEKQVIHCGLKLVE